MSNSPQAQSPLDGAASNVTIRNPEEVFKGDNLPDDLKWLIARFQISWQDPIIVLLAWHWMRVQKSQDSIQTATYTLRATLDPRIQQIDDGVKTVEKLIGYLEQLSDVLSQKPLGISQQISEELGAPITASVQSCTELSVQLSALLEHCTKTLKDATRRHLLIHLGIGCAIGSVATAWLFCLFFLR